MPGNTPKPQPEDPKGGSDSIWHPTRTTTPQWPLGTRPENAVPKVVTHIIENPGRPRSSWL